MIIPADTLTPSALVAQYGEAEMVGLTDQLGVGLPDAAKLKAAIGQAMREADGYIATRYPVLPLEAQARMADLLAPIARYRLWANEATERVRQDYEDALSELRRIADGRVALTPTMPAIGAFAVVGAKPVMDEALRQRAGLLP